MRFSIVMTHYQGSIKHEDFERCVDSLNNQTFKDFEILCFHDGPLLDDSVELPCEVQFVEERINDWGHTLRNVGIQQSSGEYIIHTNSDNVFYPNALEEINKKIESTNSDIIIYFVKMMGLNKDWTKNTIYYDNPRDYSKWELLTGYPPVYGNIDCMQLVMKTELWKKETWYNTTEQGDGIMYPKFCEKYNYKHIYKILGEHY
tara:strand:- start:18153 stop:18761 length:609 start_codon:yes stop_codon:yes gene_type:complete